MATTTTNLGLTKPSYTETADISVLNSNFDTIDSAIGELKSQVGMDSLYSNSTGATEVTLSKALTNYRFLRVGYKGGTLGFQSALLDVMQYTYRNGYWYVSVTCIDGDMNDSYNCGVVFRAASATKLSVNVYGELRMGESNDQATGMSSYLMWGILYDMTSSAKIQYVYGIK